MVSGLDEGCTLYLTRTVLVTRDKIEKQCFSQRGRGGERGLFAFAPPTPEATSGDTLQHLTITSETEQHILTATCPQNHTDEKHCSLLGASIHRPFQAPHAHASTSSHMVCYFVLIFKCRPLLSEPVTFLQLFHFRVSSRTPFFLSP